MFKSWVLICFAALSCLALSSRAVFFEFETTDCPSFIIELKDPDRIQEARNILNGIEVEKIHVKGMTNPFPASYNTGWGFHMIPESIQFFSKLDNMYCDRPTAFVEFCRLPGGCPWCPSTSKLTREIK